MKRPAQPDLTGWKPREALEKRYDSNQKFMAKWLESVKNDYRITVVNASRQIGKSFWACLYMTITGFENPGFQIKYGAKTQKHTRQIILPHLRTIFLDIPEELRPKWDSENGAFVFYNDATITVAGCDAGYAEALVGQHADVFIIDEGGAIRDLGFIVKDIAMPQTLNTGGRLLILSTPARSPGHAFKSYCEKAKKHGTYLERDIFENPRITDATIREYCELAGGPESTTWKREYLVQHVTDEATAGVPEATSGRLKAISITDEQQKALQSQWVDRYIAVVPMWNPNFTGVVWGHFDFRRNRMVVEDNLIIRKMDSMLLDEEMRARAAKLWGEAEVFRCIAPLDDSLIVEMGQLGWNFVPSTVENIDTAIQKVRHSVTHRRGVPLYINERCEDLRRQLENATWDSTRKKFEHSDLDGYYPLLTALVVWRHGLNEKHDPTPPRMATSRTFRPAHLVEAHSAKVAQVRRLFGIRK